MASQDEAESSASWFDKHVKTWASSGWDISGIETYLMNNSDLASEALLKIEYLVNLSAEMKSRLDFEWIERNLVYANQFDQWLTELQDPMNAEKVKQEYEAWASENRPWELVFEQRKNEWNSVRKGEEMLLFLARCDSLDPSSYPQLSVLLPLFKSPEMSMKIEDELSLLEQNEARQKRTIFTAVENLREQGYKVEHIVDLPMIQALEVIANKQKLHTEHEIIRLLIIDQLSAFDDNIAQEYEERRLTLLDEGNEIDLMDLKSNILAISDDLYKRLATVNDTIFNWREKGIIFPYDDAIGPDELMEWETNLPEIKQSIDEHLEWFGRYQRFANIWPNTAEQGKNYAGYLEHTEHLIDIVENLQQEWRRIELECLTIIEKYQDYGLVLDEYESIIEQDPENALKIITNSQNLWQQRVDCITKLLNLDVSFEGQESTNKRIALLKEIEADSDIIEDTERMIENYSKRRARHRRMLESELLELIRQGKASEDTTSSKFTLSEFEEFVAYSRRFGLSKNSTLTGNSVITASVNERLETKLNDELAQYKAAGWYVGHLLSLLEENPIEVAKTLGKIRALILNHGALRRRLSALPWQRDVKLAIQVQEQLQDPLKLASLNDNIPSFMRHLSTKEVEDEDFDFIAWKPEPIRKTLLPIPEQIQAPTSTLEEAHEAILDAMEEVVVKTQKEEEEPESEELSNLKQELLEPIDEVSKQQHITPVKEGEKADEDLQTEVIETKKLVSDEIKGASLDSYQTLLRIIGLSEAAKKLDNLQPSSLKTLRKTLATHVGIEPRDTRIDRMIRIILRLLPVGDDKDITRSQLIGKMSNAIPKYNSWMKSRLEARHSGAKGDFLEDAKKLGNALNRIPGPGFPLPLLKDDKPLPSSSEVEKLANEVSILLESMILDSASGVIIEGA